MLTWLVCVRVGNWILPAWNGRQFRNSVIEGHQRRKGMLHQPQQQGLGCPAHGPVLGTAGLSLVNGGVFPMGGG